MSDNTNVLTDEGWLYVASIMDLYSHKIIGWYADARMTKDLVLKALDQAYSHQKPSSEVLTIPIAVANTLRMNTKSGSANIK